MLYIEENVAGRKYKDLMRYALSKSDAIMLVFANYENSLEYERMKLSVRAKLAPLRIKTRYDPQWPSTKREQSRLIHVIDLYKASDDLYPYLKKPGSLYAWRYPCCPEDPSFFLKGKCWMLTCAHEGFCTLLGTTEEDIAFLDSEGVSYKRDEREDYFTEEYTL